MQGGVSYNSFDEPIDTTIADTEAPYIDEFTRIFKTGEEVPGVGVINRLSNIDVMRYDEADGGDGSVAVLWNARAGEFFEYPGYDAPLDQSADPVHLLFYSRLSGSGAEAPQWRHTYLGQAGRKLVQSEEDYIGLAALHPDDPRVIFISTPIDPRTGAGTNYHEIYMGVTCDEGASFQWGAVTEGSQTSQLRPIVPKWNADNMALLWLSGVYSSAQSYTLEVVGSIVRK